MSGVKVGGWGSFMSPSLVYMCTFSSQQRVVIKHYNGISIINKPQPPVTDMARAIISVSPQECLHTYIHASILQGLIISFIIGKFIIHIFRFETLSNVATSS